MEYIVEPKSRKELRRLANVLREVLGLEKVIFFPIVEILDVLSEIFDNFLYEIVEDSEFPESVHTDIDIRRGHIQIKETVYNRACEGEGRDRMTIAHEIGHFFTVCLCGFKLQRNYDEKANVPPYKDPEWQAKCFAGELMIPAHLVGKMSLNAIAMECGVSEAAARCQYEKIHNGN